MNKKIMAVAVAGALAAPGLALAQASVTITGFVKVAVGQISNSNSASFRNTTIGNAATPSLNSSEWRLNDDGPTRITFQMRDQIDNDMTGVAQLELRNTIDGNSAVGGAGFGSSSGNQYVGIESKSMGTMRLGSLDQHYILGTDTGAVYGPTQVASGLMGYAYLAAPTLAAAGQAATGVGAAPAGTVITGNSQAATQTSHTGASRTRNLVRWDSPDWNGMRLGVGYSFNTTSGQEGDLSTPQRKGNSLNINPTYTAATWRVGYSYLDDKRDATASLNATNWKGNRLYGDVKFGDFTVGLNWDKMQATQIYGTIVGASLNTASANLSNRTAWSLPVKYQTGKHVVTGLYSKANNDTTVNSFAIANGVNSALLGDNGAKFWSVSYAYLFSGRTSIGIGYAALTNNSNGAYTLSGEAPGLAGTNVQNGYASANSGAYVGEKQTYLGVSVRQTF